MTLLLFRVRALYFRETAVEAIQNSNAIRENGSSVQKELLFALESARTRLAVAIAEETKSTPRDRWFYYLDTADQVRQFIGKLRKADGNALWEYQGWICALEALRRLPIRNDAFRLCQALRDIVTELE